MHINLQHQNAVQAKNKHFFSSVWAKNVSSGKKLSEINVTRKTENELNVCFLMDKQFIQSSSLFLWK